MKRYAFSSTRIGLISISIGALSWLTLFAPFGLSMLHRSASAALGLVGFVCGAMSVKTKAGVAGIFLSLLAIMYYLFFLLLWISYSHS